MKGNFMIMRRCHLMKYAAPLALLIAAQVPLRAQSLPPAPTPVPTPQVTPSSLALAREIVEAVQAENAFNEQMKSTTDQMRRIVDSMEKSKPAVAQAFRDNPKLKDAAIAIADKHVRAAMARMRPQMLEVLPRLYAQTYTEAEMRDILSFYHTPSGQAMIRKTPAMMKEMQLENIRILMPELSRFAESFRQEMMQEFLKTLPKDKQKDIQL